MSKRQSASLRQYWANKGEQMASQVTTPPKHVTGKLRTFAGGLILLDSEISTAIADCACSGLVEEAEANAAELVSRWNEREQAELVIRCCEQFVKWADSEGGGCSKQFQVHVENMRAALLERLK